MRYELRLDFSGINVHASADEHLLAPPGDIEKTFIVAAGEIAGPKPAVWRIRRARGFFIVPISEGYVRAANPHLTDIAVHLFELDLGEEHRPSDRSRLSKRI